MAIQTYRYTGNKRKDDRTEYLDLVDAHGIHRRIEINEDVDLDDTQYAALIQHFELPVSSGSPAPSPPVLEALLADIESPQEGDSVIFSNGVWKNRPGGGAKARYKEFVAGDFGIINPAIMPVLSGTFTPDDDQALVEVFPNFKMLESAGAHCAVYLLIAPSSVTGQLTPGKLSDWTSAGDGGVLPNGASKYLLGSIGANNFSSTMARLLTPLTPGQSYKFEVAVVIVGFASNIALSSKPWSVGMAKNPTGKADGSYLYWAVATDANVVIGYADHASYDYKDVVKATLAYPSGSWSGEGRCRMTPDGSRGIVTTQWGANIAIFTTGALDGSAPAINVYALPTGATSAVGVAISPDGTTAYLCVTSGTNAGKILPVTLATGAFGALIDPGLGTGALGWDAQVDASGTYLYVTPHQAGNARVYRVKLSDSTVSTLVLSTTAGAYAHTCAISPDGKTLWVGGAGAAGASKVWKIDLTGGAFNNVGNFAVSGGAELSSIRAFGDGNGLIMAKTETGGSVAQGTATNQIHHHLVYPGVTLGQEYTTWINSLGDPANPPNSPAYDIALTPNGAMYVPDHEHNKLNIWFGGQAWNPHSSEFWASTLRVLITGAA